MAVRSLRSFFGSVGRRPLAQPLAAIAILVGWAAFTHPNWFFSLQTLTSGDWGYLTPQTMQSWVRLPRVWTSENGLGLVDYIGLAFYPFHFLFGLLSVAGIPFELSERLLFAWPAAILPLVGGYHLSRRLGANWISSLLGGLVYGSNTYILLIETGQLTVVMAYGLAPFILASFTAGLYSSDRWAWMSTAVLLGISFIYEPRISFIICGILITWTFFQTLANPRSRGLARQWARRTVPKIIHTRRTSDQRPSMAGDSTSGVLKRALGSAAHLIRVLAGAAVLSAYWIIPAAVTGGSEASTLLPAQEFPTYMNLAHALFLNHPFWTGAAPMLFSVQTPVAVFAILPILAFAALLVKPGRVSLGLAVIALVGVFLVKQDNPPFSGVYNWLFVHVPGFDLFREASKFYLLIAIAFAPLIAITMTESARRAWRSTRARKVAVLGVTLSLVGVLAIPAFPAAEGRLGGIYNPTPAPSEYMTFNQVLTGNLSPSEFYRTFWWPAFERFGAYTSQVPYLSGFTEVQSDMNFLLTDRSNLWTLFDNATTASYFDLASIRYVVVPYDAANDLYPSFGPEAQFLAQVDNQAWLQPLDVPGIQSHSFVNENAQPYVYGLTLPISSLSGKPSPTFIESTVRNISFSTNGDDASLQIDGSSEVQTLVLSQHFDRYWRMACGNGYQASADDMLGLSAFAVPLGISLSCSIAYSIQASATIGIGVTIVGYLVIVSLMLVVTWRQRRTHAD